MLRDTSKKFVILTAAILLNPFICGEEFDNSSVESNNTPITRTDKAENFILLSKQSHQLAIEALSKSEKNLIEKITLSKYDKHAKRITDERACNHFANSIYFTVQAMNNGGIKVQGKNSVPNLVKDAVPFFTQKEMRKKMHNAMHKKAKNTLSKNDCKNLAHLMLNEALFTQALNQMTKKSDTLQKQGRENFLRALKQTTNINANASMLQYKYKIGNDALQELNNKLMQSQIELPEYTKLDIENLAQQFDQSFGSKLSKIKPVK